MSKKHYIDRDVYHRELCECKKNGELSKKAIDLFYKHAREVRKKYKGRSADDADDLLQRAVEDFLKYWKKFKDKSLVQLKIKRNLKNGEKIVFDIKNCGKIIFEASNNPTEPHQFLIEEKINKTLQNLVDINKNEFLQITLDKIKSKITFMDLMNGHSPSEENRSSIQIFCIDDSFHDRKKDFDFFNDPPNAFSYFTSLIDNAMIKFLDEIDSPEQREGKISYFGSFRDDPNGIYSI
jgi:hypothetical protein